MEGVVLTAEESRIKGSFIALRGRSDGKAKSGKILTQNQ